MQRLSSSEHEDLRWNLYPGMVRIMTMGDGSCFFHAIARSYFEPYIIGQMADGSPINRSQFIRDFRRDLAIKLGQTIDPLDPTSSMYYDTLSRGQLRELSRSLPQLSLRNMQKELNSSMPVDNKYNEYISNLLNKDIYLLDANRRSVYVTGSDSDILYKNRPSIVILVTPGHYELVGIRTYSGVQTVFHPKDDFIMTIRSKLGNV